jgi:outer membrane lipoprotein-sorting protein
MNTLPTISRRARWAIPVGAVALAGAVTAGSLISTAQASPELPLRTPAQLLASVAGRDAPPPALTGTVVETASLGLPQLPGASNQNSVTSLLAGSHTIKVWYADPQHIRLAVPVQMSETDAIRDGRQVSVWQSNSNTVTRMQLPAKASAAAPAKAVPSQVPLTPQQAASQALKAVGPSTRVTVDRTVTVAGQPAYQLVLSPKSGSSLIGRVSIAIDATRNVPLRVQVFARGAASPAIQVGFTSISFVKPAAANFNFTTPAGAKVKVVNPTAVDGPRASAKGAKASGGRQVIGKGWLSVAVLPESDLAGVMGAGSASSSASSSAAGVGSQSVSSGSGESGAVAAALMKSATPVHGAWGSGRLLQTSLASVLITNSGHVLVGSVTPAVLYAAAAQVK